MLEKIKALEGELALYRQALENSRQEMQAFAYSVSHDLRAPLRAIEGFSRILLEDFASSLNEDGQRFLRHITTNTQTLGSQIDDLLRYYRFGKNPPARSEVDSDAICREALTSISPEAASRISIQGPLPRIYADPAHLKEIFGQLISNAFKFTAGNAEPRIEIGAHLEPHSVTFHVRDNGVGFDMKHADRLFQVFQKLHSPNEYSGNGIGLAIVKRLVQAHGGCARAEAAPSEGATFYFTLPQSSLPSGLSES